MNDRRWRIHWAWVPAAVLSSVIGWTRYGWWTLLLIALGLGVAAYAERKARKRRG